MLDWFFEKQDFFQLKDVEKMCPAEKGIVLQSIKDVLTSLVDDGLVDSERIGVSTYYWSLPSKALKKRQEMIQNSEKELNQETEKNKELSSKLEMFQQTEDNEEKRQELISQYNEMMARKEELLKELSLYKDNDPQVYNQMRESVEISKKACNRWIENIYSLRSWLKNKFRIDESTIDKQFEIPSDLDYIS